MDPDRFSTIRTLWLPLLAVLALARSAAAQGNAQADALFQSGLSEMQAGNYESGCPKLSESYRLDPLPGGLFTLAECEAAWGKAASAIEHYQSFVDSLVALPPARRNKFDERRRLALEKIAALDATAPDVTVEVAADAPESLVVKRNGEPLEPAHYGVAKKVDPGHYSFTVQVEGQPQWERSVTLALNDRAQVQVPWPLFQPAVAEVPVAPPAAERADLPQSPLRPWFYGSGAVGIAGLAAGAIAGGIALAKKKVIDAHCAKRECDTKGHDAAASGQRAALVSTVGFAVGLAGAAAATTLFLLERRQREARPASALRRGLRPTLLQVRAGAGLGVEGLLP